MGRHEHYVTPRYQSNYLQHLRWAGDPPKVSRKTQKILLWLGILGLYISTLF